MMNGPSTFGAQSNDAMIGQALGVNKNLSLIAEILRTAFPMSASQGNFTCAAAATQTITNSNSKQTSAVFFTPTNASAAALQAGANALYLSSRSDGSFVLSGAGAAAGTETFTYIIVNVG